jgi:ABC-2 type transport system permease protein
MRNILAIAGKELRAYFHSPIAYLVMAVWTGLSGLVFYDYTGMYVTYSFRMQAMGGAGQSMPSINEAVIRGMLEGFLMVVLLFLIPLITMRLYSEEKRSGTMELLLTSPLTDFQIIIGKYLGALTLYAVMVALSMIYIGVLFLYGNPSGKPVLANVLGLFLFGAALLALGMWFSTLTKNQIIAGVISMACFLILYILTWPSSFSSGTASRVMSYMALSSHTDNFAKGVIDLQDLVYYFSVIVLGLFLTSRSVEALKGRA